MSVMTLSMLLQAEGAAAAKAAVDSVGKSITALGAATRTGAQADTVAAAAKRANASAAGALAVQNRAAAGGAGNLVAQFNDLGMMMAAGQNPLQLAMQQGTQITQIIGPMGAAGAVSALGGAFVSMLNPLNLVTLGVIATAGLMVNWLTSAGDDAAALTADLDRMLSALEGITAETEKLRLARGMMLSGAQSEDEQVALEEINRLNKERLEISLQLEEQSSQMRRAAGVGAQTVADAKQQELQAQIAIIDAKLAALDKQRELNTATENGLAAVKKVQALMAAIGNANISGPWANVLPSIQAAIGKAREYAATIQSAQAAANAQLEQMAFEFSPGGQALTAFGDRTPGGTAAQNALAVRNRPEVTTVPPGVGSGGGAAAARDEANALQQLIASLEGEIEALRVQGPLQREMLQHREAMVGATEAERLKVEELIATREREALAIEGAKARAEFFEDIGMNALDTLITKGESFNEVLGNIIQSLIKAAIQAALFGSGPFGSLFGGTSIMTQIFPALGAKATGGMVTGPGSGTSDSIPTLLSNGEFVINAKATARNRHLLEAINGGGLPGYANGGMVGGGRRRDDGSGDGRSGPATMIIDVRGAQGNLEIQTMIRRGVQMGLSMYDRDALPRSVQRVSADQKRVG